MATKSTLTGTYRVTSISEVGGDPDSVLVNFTPHDPAAAVAGAPNPPMVPMYQTAFQRVVAMADASSYLPGTVFTQTIAPA